MGEKEGYLKQKMVELWVEFYSNPVLLSDQETARSDSGEDRWDAERNLLISKVKQGKSIPDHSSPLMILSVLDHALVGFGHEHGGWRIPPSIHPVAERDWLLVQRPLPLEVRRHTKQSGHLRNWLQHHLIVPKYYSRSLTSPSKNQRVINIDFAFPSDPEDPVNLLTNRPLKVWFGTFPDGVDPYWPDLEQGKCSCERLTDQERRRESIFTSLKNAQEAKADVVIFPELSICPPLQQEIAAWLYDNPDSGFVLVVPGSFHERDTRHPEALPFNRSALYSGDGNIIFRHNKFFPFGVANKCKELISAGDSVTLLMTPIGVVSLAICRDFCDGEPWVRDLWSTLAPDWLLVPSMSFQGGITAHQEQAKFMYDNCGTRILVANQWPLQPYPGEKSCEHGFAYPASEGRRGVQEVKDSPSDRLKTLDLPGWNAEK